jgi:hypothetical protein
MMRLVSPFSATVASLLEMRYLWDVPHALDGAALARRIGSRAPHTLPGDAVRAAITGSWIWAPCGAHSARPPHRRATQSHKESESWNAEVLFVSWAVVW